MLALDSPAGVPVVLVRADGAGGDLALGSAAAADPASAARRALIEALAQTGHRTPVRVEVCDVRTPADHASLYDDHAWRQRLGWMLAGPVVDLSSVAAVRSVRLPARAAVYRYPNPGLPVHVVRALDPALIPLTFGYDSDPDGRPDLRRLWRRSGRELAKPWDPHPLG
jgi:ribosomal protein S12 methylthiotransferase accessory factor YcaO